MTAASIVRPHAGTLAGLSPFSKIAVAVVALAASVVFTAAAVVLASALFAFPVAVPVATGEAIAASSNPWWWLDAIGAFSFGVVAIAAVVEAIRFVARHINVAPTRGGRYSALSRQRRA